MRTLGGLVMGAIMVAALAGVAVGPTARTRCGCACVLALAGMFVGAALVAEEGR